MNKVILIGRLVRNPEVKYSQGADPLAICRYTLAVNRRMKQNGEQEADFINCVAFGRSGEFAEKYFKKGQQVGVIGRMQVRSWDKDGEKRWSTDVVIEEQYFADSKKDGGSSEGGAKPPGESKGGFYPAGDIDDSDLPF